MAGRTVEDEAARGTEGHAAGVVAARGAGEGVVGATRGVEVGVGVAEAARGTRTGASAGLDASGMASVDGEAPAVVLGRTASRGVPAGEITPWATGVKLVRKSTEASSREGVDSAKGKEVSSKTTCREIKSRLEERSRHR